MKNYDKKRWQILIASCLINLCIGSLYAWSVFASPMAKYLSEVTGTAITSLAICFTVANSVGPITMILGGVLNQKLGPKKIILIGGVMFGVGMIASGFARSITALIITYGLLCGLGVGMVYGCTISNTIRFFPDKKGLIGGIATASYGISSVIIPIIANVMIDAMGITMSFKILGAVMLAVICLSAMVIEECPATYVPTGYIAPASSNKSGGIIMKPGAMIKSPLFYVMLIMLCCGAFSGMMIISQASPLAQRITGMSAASAATIVSIIALCNTGGRILSGAISDKIGALNTIRFVFAGSVLAMAVLYISCSGSTLFLIAGVLVTGLAFGAIMGLYPGFTAAQFGPKYNGINFGIMFIGFAAAGYFGPTVMTKLYQGTGSDQTAFIVAALLGVLGFVLTFIFQKLAAKKN